MLHPIFLQPFLDHASSGECLLPFLKPGIVRVFVGVPLPLMLVQYIFQSLTGGIQSEEEEVSYNF